MHLLSSFLLRLAAVTALASGVPAAAQDPEAQPPAQEDASVEATTQDPAPEAGQDPAEPPAPAPADDGAAPAAPAPGNDVPPPARYRFLESRGALVSSWLGSGVAQELSLGTSAGGRELLAIQLGAPGPTPLEERSTILLVGGLDGVSVSGSQAVLAIIEALLASPDALPQEVTFVAVPWANPDGLARYLESGCTDGRNDRPLDDDHDGAVDEDVPDDLDGDGLILEMLIEDPAGAWARDEDGRLLRPALPGEAPRYRRTREGRDDDGDGEFNEDQVGGVELDNNFPLGWVGPWTGVLSGPVPLSEPEARALADLALSRRTAVALFFQGNHGSLAAPGGVAGGPGVLELPFAADLPAYRGLVERFTRATGRGQAEVLALHDLHREPEPGAAIDWMYAALGTLAAEVAVWGPTVEGRGSDRIEGQFPRDASDAPGGNRGVRSGSLSQEPARPLASHVDRAWTRWLDETRGGIGFVDWQPVDLGDGRQALVGGWEPLTCFNPPAEVLPEAIEGLDAFVLEVGRGLPRLECEVLDGSRNGRVALLRVAVRNAGELPTGVGPAGPGQGVRLELRLPPGVELLSGEERVEVGHLPGLGRSAPIDWLLLAPDDTVFELEVDSRWGPAVKKEVRL